MAKVSGYVRRWVSECVNRRCRSNGCSCEINRFCIKASDRGSRRQSHTPTRAGGSVSEGVSDEV